MSLEDTCIHKYLLLNIIITVLCRINLENQLIFNNNRIIELDPIYVFFTINVKS